MGEHVEAVEDGEGPDEDEAARQERLPPATPNPPHAAAQHALLTFNVIMIPLMFGFDTKAIALIQPAEPALLGTLLYPL